MTQWPWSCHSASSEVVLQGRICRWAMSKIFSGPHPHPPNSLYPPLPCSVPQEAARPRLACLPASHWTQPGEVLARDGSKEKQGLFHCQAVVWQCVHLSPKAELMFAGPSPTATATSSPCPCRSDLHGLQRAVLSPLAPPGLGHWGASAGAGTEGRDRSWDFISLAPPSSVTWGWWVIPLIMKVTAHALSFAESHLFLGGPDWCCHPPDMIFRTAIAKGVGFGVRLPDINFDLARHYLCDPGLVICPFQASTPRGF